MGLHTPLHCRYWPPTCTASVCLCDGACVRPNDVEDAALPERGHLLRVLPAPLGAPRRERPSVPRSRECGAGLTPSAVQWCRCGGFRGPDLAESVPVRRRFRAGVGVFCQTLAKHDPAWKEERTVKGRRSKTDVDVPIRGALWLADLKVRAWVPVPGEDGKPQKMVANAATLKHLLNPSWLQENDDAIRATERMV